MTAKQRIYWPLGFLVTIILLITACEEETEWTNPWDNKGELNPADWKQAYATTQADVSEYTDTSIFTKTKIDYRIYAFHGSCNSAKMYEDTPAELPPPSELQIDFLALNNVTLHWQDNSEGEEGFGIDRKSGNSSWEVGYGETGPNDTTYTDTSLVLNNTLYYRVYSFAGKHGSTTIQDNVETAIEAPTNLQLAFPDLENLNLTWDDNTTGEDGFKIDRKIGIMTGRMIMQLLKVKQQPILMRAFH